MKNTQAECYQTDFSRLSVQIQEIFKKQKDSFFKQERWSTRDRIERLSRMENWIVNHRSDIIDAIYSDFRKPASEVESQEIFVILTEIRHARKHLKKWMKPVSARPTLPLLLTRSWTEYFPKGVVLIISPWNFPFLLSMGPLVSAIAAGNRAILKPSEISHYTSLLIRTMMEEIFPPDEVMVFCGRKEVATKLLKHPFDHIFFTGSTEVGKIVMSAAAQNMASVTMELGGKSPVIVDETADLKDAAQKIVWGKFMNAGQTCVAPDYVLVQEHVYQQFLDLAKETLAGYYGNSEAERAASPDFARIIDSRHYQRLKILIEDSVQSGAKIETGGIPDNGEMYIPPTILTNAPVDAKIMQEEIFGPVLPILRYQSEDDALRQVNHNGEPLAVYIFSRDRKKIRHIFSRTKSGSGGINEVVIQFIHPNLPFGGIGKSGFGKAHGFYGFETFSNHRSFIRSHRWSPLKLLYPPFTGWKKKIIEILIRYF